MSSSWSSEYRSFQISGNARSHAGDVYGDVYHQYPGPPPPERPRPRPVIPFSRDRDFVGREGILKVIAEKLGEDGYHNRFAIHGFGGIGKSQIAIEFAHRWSQEHPDRWVFWVSANSEAKFTESYGDIAQVVGLIDPHGNSLKPVYRWLSNPDNGSWLMIFDNADDREVLFDEEASKSLSKYIPQATHGCVLITSRNQTGVELAGGESNASQVDCLDEEDAVELLARRIPQKTDREQLRMLSEELEYIPLALAQAAACITRTRIPLTAYLESFANDELARVAHLAHKWHDIRRADVHNAILMALWVTFEKVAEVSAVAAFRLCVMSMFERHGIPSKGKLASDEAHGVLLEWSLIQRGENGDTYAMHRIIQVCMNAYIKFVLRPNGMGNLELFRTQALRDMDSCLEDGFGPDSDHNQMSERWSRLMPHARKICRGQVDPADKFTQMKFLLDLAIFELILGNTGRSETLLRTLIGRVDKRLCSQGLEKSLRGGLMHLKANCVLIQGVISTTRLQMAKALFRQHLGLIRQAKKLCSPIRLGISWKVIRAFSTQLKIRRRNPLKVLHEAVFLMRFGKPRKKAKSIVTTEDLILHAAFLLRSRMQFPALVSKLAARVLPCKQRAMTTEPHTVLMQLKLFANAFEDIGDLDRAEILHKRAVASAVHFFGRVETSAVTAARLFGFWRRTGKFTSDQDIGDAFQAVLEMEIF